MNKEDIVSGIKDAASIAVKELTPSLKGEVLNEVNKSLGEYAKSEEVGTLRTKMVEVQDYIDTHRKSVEGNVIQSKPYMEILGDHIKKGFTQARETGREVEIEVPMFQKVTSLIGSGLNQGSPRPVDPTFAYMRQPSGIRQAFMNQMVSSANLVVPTLVGTTLANGGYANQGIAFGYDQPADQGDQDVVERVVNFKRYEGTNWVGEDVLNDNGTLLSTFSEDLYAAAAQTVAVALANGDGSGTGSAGQINGLLNGTAIPSGTSAFINSSTGAIQILRQDFPGASLTAALAGGQVSFTNPAAGTTNVGTGLNPTYQGFVNAIYALRPIYRNDLVWLLSSQALAQIRRLVDAYGRPLFDESMMSRMPVAEGQPAYVGRFLGIDVYEEWYAQLFTAGTRVRFGVLGSRSRAFRIYDRMMATLTVTPITKLGYSTFYIRGRLNTLCYDVQSLVALEFVGA